jgi:signal transduction histidine kinase
MRLLGLRTKFFLYSNTLIVVTMGIVTVLSVVHEREARYLGIVARSVSLTEALSVPVTDALMYGELGLVAEEGVVDSYVSGLLDRNPDLARYVIVADSKGVVTHSNRWELIGRRFERSLGCFPAADVSTIGQVTAAEGERILEVRTPLNISTRCWGSMTIGFSLVPIEQQVRAVAKRAALVALALMLGNSILTAAYVEKLIRPILSLHNTMRQAGHGDLTVRAPVRRWDEVGELSAAFNRMMEELEGAREREGMRWARLAHTEKMAAVGTLAAGVAHEVNNPLAGILTCLEAIQDRPEDAEMRERYLGLVQDGIKRIEHTVLNLLDFSRPSEIRPEPTSLVQNLHQVVEMTEFQLRKNHVDVSFDVEPDEPIVLADHFQMKQLFLNLVLNAIQAMPNGGKLTLRTRRSGDDAVVEVTDTGVGIVDEIRERIFDPFFSTREVGQGTGLGLSVSYSIVTAHGGAIEVDSQAGKGATFRITLPLSRHGETSNEART